MNRVYSSVVDLIGQTPILKLERIKKEIGLECNLYAKLECLNPTGSAKDRAAGTMIEEAQKQGVLQPGGTIIEPTSGNTGIGIASVAAVKGYHAVIVMPDTMSVERRLLMKAYGAELVLTEGAKGMSGAIEKAEELHRIIPNSIIASQFTNPANSKAHYMTTGPEIWNALGNEMDVFVATVGTGGTISGTGRYLKEKKPDIHIIAVEPSSSPVLSGGKPGSHGIQGIGAGFVPEVLERNVYDEVITVSEEEAYHYGRMMGKRQGILVGISSGAAIAAAIKYGRRIENSHKNIVALLPDSGDRYLSTPMFSE